MINIGYPSFKGILNFSTDLTEQKFANIPKKKIKRIEESRKNLQKIVEDEANFSKNDIVEVTLTTESKEAKKIMDRDLMDGEEIIEEGSYILNKANYTDEVLEVTTIPNVKQGGKNKVIFKYHYIPSTESAEKGAIEIPEKVANIDIIEKKIKKLAKKVKKDIEEYPAKMKKHKKKTETYHELFLSSKNQDKMC